MIDGKDSPHLQMSKALGEVYCGFGEKGRHTPPSTVETLDRTLSAMGVGHARYIKEVHRGAEHGYALPERDVFDKQWPISTGKSSLCCFGRQLSDR